MEKVILNIAHDNVAEETIFDKAVASVSYNFSMYSCKTKVSARIKQKRGLVEIRAYGLMITRHLKFENAPEGVWRRLEYSGYEVSRVFKTASMVKDFGPLSSQNYEVSSLIAHFNRLPKLPSWVGICDIVRRESSEWGEPVFDVAGRLVVEEGKVKRDPFARAGRLALKKELQKARREKFIKDYLNLGDQKNDEGVDL